MGTCLLSIRRNLFAFILLVSAFLACLFVMTPRADAAAGINQQLNFQGRLLNAAGATVPDGFYNIQFKIYQDGDGQSVGNTTGSPAGTLMWTESHLNNNSQGVTVKNGYLSVQLGAITAFGSSVDWDQDTLWLSMNIANTNPTCTPFASCSPDGEMIPMKRLSSVPYAFNSAQLGGLTSTQFLQLAQGLQTDASTNASIYVNKSGVSGNILQLQSGGVDKLVVENNGQVAIGQSSASYDLDVNGTINAVTSILAPDFDTATAATLNIGAASATAINIGDTGVTTTIEGALTVSEATQLNGGLTVDNTGNVAFQRGTDFVTTGSQDNVDFGTGVVIRLTGASAQTITGIAGGVDGRILTLVNAAAQAAIISNNSGSSSAANRIITGSGTDIALSAGATLQLVYDSGASLWRVSSGTAADPNSNIQNQNSTDQTANFRISGTGQANTSFTSPLFDAVSGAVSLGTSAATGVTIGGTTNTTSLVVQGAAAATYTIGTSSGTGTITLGQSTASNTIAIGSAAGASATQTITIGTSATATSITNVTIGSTIGSGATTLQAGTGNLNFNATSALFTEITGTRSLGVQTRTTNVAGTSLTISAGTGGAGGSAFTGGTLTLQGGNAAGTGNANGGSVTLNGGSGVGTGVTGLVVIGTPTYSSATTQSCGVDCTITQANVDTHGQLVIDATATNLIVTLPDPTITTAGRIVYITAATGSNDFTLTTNGGGTGNEVSMRQNASATMVWNGSDWTAAGASSSTTLQAAYNNTLTSAGGAEIILNAPGGNADGLTIRNNATTPITGGILEVQTSIGSNLFSVNNNASEYATNGGAETAGASASTFPSNTWDTTTGGTVDRYTTVGENIATGQASIRVQTTTTNHGARNRLSSSLTSGLTYTISFAVKAATNFSTLQVLYSPDGTTSGTTQCATAQVATSAIWSRIVCEFVAAGTITSSNSILIRQTDATARTYYLDNLSVNVNASVTYASDGSVDAALGSNWTAFGTLDALTRDTSIIYDTSGSVAVDAPNNTDRGVRNNLTVTPATSTQYLVTFFARSSNAFTDIRVRYSRDGGTNFVSCVDYNTQTLSTTSFTEITCIFTTDGTTATDPDLIIDQPTGSDRIFYIDALSIALNTNNSSNVQVGGANKGGPVTLFTLDRSSGDPIAANNEAYLGSMYYDTETGRIQCYEADGWGACGAQPDNIVNLNPEYQGAVLNGSGIGTMTADFCSNDTALSVNTTLCATGEAKNFYRWRSPQATQQTYSVIVSYQLPATFKGFASDDTVQLVARTDSTTNAAVTYEMFKSNGSTVTKCGTSETTVVTTANTWQSVGINGNEATGCSFTAASAGNFVIFKLNLKANSNANAYVSTLSFTTTGR